MLPITVVAAVIERAGRYLICQRPANKRYGGLWEFPGGKVHDGETLRDAVSRELREELRLTVTEAGETPVFSHLDQGSGYMIEFVAISTNGEPELHEHVAVAWVAPEKFASYPLAPSDAEFVKRILSRS